MRPFREFLPCKFLPFVFCALLSTALSSELNAQQAGRHSVFCGALFDSATATLRSHVLISIEGQRIVSVDAAASAPAGAVDLAGETCLPGLIDSHTHVMLHGDVTSEDYDVQLLKQSDAFRAPPFATWRPKVPVIPMWT